MIQPQDAMAEIEDALAGLGLEFFPQPVQVATALPADAGLDQDFPVHRAGPGSDAANLREIGGGQRFAIAEHGQHFKPARAAEGHH